MAVSCSSSNSTDLLVESLQVTFSGAAKAAIELELKHTLREFCVRSHAWTTFLALKVKEGVTVYGITPDENQAEVCLVIAVAVDARPVAGWSGDYLPPPNRGDGPKYTTNEDKLIADKITEITLDASYVADVEKSLVVTLALRPKHNQLYIPDMLGLDFFDALLAGTAARLMGHVNRPYTDPDGARRNRRLFLAGLVIAREKTKTRFGKLSVPWVYPQMAPGRRYR